MLMSNTLQLEIVTPTGLIFDEPVACVTVPGTEGEMEIHPLHVPVLTLLDAGEITVRKPDNSNCYLAVGSGFIKITGDKVVVFTDMALKADEIDELKAEEARKRAEERLQGKLSAEEAATVNASLTKSIAMLAVKQRRRG